MFRYLPLFTAIVILAAACGDDDEDMGTDASPTPSDGSVEHDWSVQYMQLRDARTVVESLGLAGDSLSPSAYYECNQIGCPEETPGEDSWGCLSILPTGDPANAESLRPDDPPRWYSVQWSGTAKDAYSAPPEPVVNEPTASLEARSDVACGARYAMEATAAEAAGFLADNGLEGLWMTGGGGTALTTCPTGSTCPIPGIPEETSGCLSLSIFDQPARTQTGPRPTIHVSWFSAGGPETPDGTQLLYSTTLALEEFEAIADSLQSGDCIPAIGPTPNVYDHVPFTQVIKPSYWRLSEPPDGRRLEVGIAVGNSCDSFERIEVTETETSVTVQTFSRKDNSRQGCDDILLHHEETVELDEPLGDRELLGCAPEEIWYIDHEVDCAEPGNV
jgi:hypothetical protein